MNSSWLASFTGVRLQPVRGSLLLVFGCIGCDPSPPPMADGAFQVTVGHYNIAEGWLVNYPKQRKVFAAVGLLWLFHSNGADGVYRISDDGGNWSPPELAVDGSHFGHRFAVAFNGSHFHFASCTAQVGADVLYRRATPMPDGSLAYSGDAQVAFDIGDSVNGMYPQSQRQIAVLFPVGCVVRCADAVVAHLMIEDSGSEPVLSKEPRTYVQRCEFAAAFNPGCSSICFGNERIPIWRTAKDNTAHGV